MTKQKKAAARHYDDIRTHARALVQATSQIADDKVSEARHQLTEILESISEKAEEVEHMAIEKAKQVDGHITENPYKTAAIALGIGALLGYIFSRRAR
jgi:ElaB/YqjD/DUF883 family membrane-anchored ribosome-binding protein